MGPDRDRRNPPPGGAIEFPVLRKEREFLARNDNRSSPPDAQTTIRPEQQAFSMWNTQSPVIVTIGKVKWGTLPRSARRIL